MFVYLLFVTLFWFTLQDCPINPYPRKTFIGSINAELNNNPRLHGTPQQYSALVSQPFEQNAIYVSIGVNGFQLTGQNELNFYVEHLPTTLTTQLKFMVFVKSSTSNWRSLYFKFFATQNQFFLVSTINANAFQNTRNENQLILYRPINLRQISTTSSPNNLVLSLTLSGIQLNARPLDPSVVNLQRQLASVRRFSTNIRMVASLTQSIEERKSIYFKISARLIGSFVSANIQTNTTLRSLRISYIVFGKTAFQQGHSFVRAQFTLANQNQYKYTGLRTSQKTFSGLLGFTMPRDQFYSFNLTSTNYLEQKGFNVETNYKYFALDFSFIEFQKKQSQMCKDCKNSPNIYDNRFCVQTCPRGFSRIERLGTFFCQACDIEQLKVVDPQTGFCVCAKRHYLDNQQNICKPCRYDCMSCSAPNLCLTCDNSQLQTKRKIASGGRCQCPSIGFYDDKVSQNIVCQKCHSKCLTCNGPFYHDCLSCPSDKQLTRLGICVCKNGFSQDSSGNCNCNPPRTLNNNICFDTNAVCNINQTEQFVQTTKRCVCKPGFTQIGDQCIKCGANSIFDQSTLTCKCINNTISINGQCTSCPNNQILNQDTNTCICRPGTFKTKQANCVTCPTRMIFINQKCQCIFNYYESSAGVCERCLRDTDGPKCRRTITA